MTWLGKFERKRKLNEHRRTRNFSFKNKARTLTRQEPRLKKKALLSLPAPRMMTNNLLENGSESRTTKEDDDAEKRIPIDSYTLKAIKIEFSSLNSRSRYVHDIATKLSQSESVMIHYSEYLKSTLTDAFSKMSVVGENGTKATERLKRAFQRLANGVGSLDRNLSDWTECQTLLEEILILPQPQEQEEEEQRQPKQDKGIKQKSLQKYLDRINQLTHAKGILPHDQTWRQVTFPPSPIPPPPSSTHLDDQIKQTVEPLILKEKAHDQAIETYIRQKALTRRPLTRTEKSRVKTALYGIGPLHEILASIDTDSVTRESIQKLRPGTWLNDEVIHFFFQTLAKRDETFKGQKTKRRSHFFKSFFITKLLDENGYNYRNVRRWSKRVPGKDVFQLDKIFFPVNVGNMHWCTAVIFVQEKKIQFYDSMGGSGQRYLNGLFRYLKDEMKDKQKKEGDEWEEWELIPCQEDTPQQENGYDCGVFTCMFADFLAKGWPLCFGQKDVTEWRERIALSILNGRAVD